jgi:hypothetical protein
MARNMVDGGEIFESLIRGLLNLIGAILRLIAEIVIRFVLEIVVEIIGRAIKAVALGAAHLAWLVWMQADRLHRWLLALAGRVTTRRALAHAIVAGLLITCGFTIGAGSAAAYHHIHPPHAQD